MARIGRTLPTLVAVALIVATALVLARPRPLGEATMVVVENAPREIAAGRGFTVTMVVKNVGATPLRPPNHRIGSQSPQDNDIWGTGRVPLPRVVEPGAEIRIPFSFVAPKKPGQYDFQWRMLEEGSHWFGDKSSNVRITVVAP